LKVVSITGVTYSVHLIALLSLFMASLCPTILAYVSAICTPNQKIMFPWCFCYLLYCLNLHFQHLRELQLTLKAIRLKWIVRKWQARNRIARKLLAQRALLLFTVFQIPVRVHLLCKSRHISEPAFFSLRFF